MKTSIARSLPLWSAFALAACSSDAVGPKPDSPSHPDIEVVTTLSKTALGVGDTLTFTYSIKNLKVDTLTLNTSTGCQILPVLDQVEGPKMQDLFESNCPGGSTQRKLAPGETVTFHQILRGYDASKSAAQQTPGYLLTKGTYDASALVTATELGGSVRSDWVRFKVNIP